MKSTILIVDDESTLAESVREHFESEGFEAVAASRAEAAVELVRSRRFDVLLSDMRMPGMSGLDLLAAVRDLPSAPTVILMSAYGTMETIVSAFRLGAFDFLEKPATLETLTETVDRALACREPSSQLAGEAMPLHALRERTGRVGPVSVDIAGDPAAPEAATVWHVRTQGRTTAAFVCGHVDPTSRLALHARLLVKALAGVVDVRSPAPAVQRIVEQLKALDCAAAVRGLVVGLFESAPTRRVVGAVYGVADIARVTPESGTIRPLGEGATKSIKSFQADLAGGDVVFIADPRLIEAAGTRWGEVLARTGRLIAEGESNAARRVLSMLSTAAVEAPVVVAVHTRTAVETNGMIHVRVASNRAGLVEAREAAEQFAFDAPLSDEAAHELITAVQEAVLNCVQWAYPGREGPVYVTLSRKADHVRASVRDRGLGFDVGEAYATATDASRDPLRRSGRGLLLMHGLADRFEIISRPGRGTNIVFEKDFDSRRAEREEPACAV